MDWKEKLLEAHALDLRAWRLAVAEPTTLAGEAEPVLVCPARGGGLELVAPDGTALGAVTTALPEA